MWHKIMTVSLFLAVVQGAALADKMEIPSPPPKDDVAQALTSCQADLKLAVADGAECRGVDPDKYLDTLRNRSGGTTTVVVTPVAPKGKWRTRIEDVPSGDKHCLNGGTVELTGRDKNRNGKLDDKEVTGRSYACKGDAGSAGSQGATGVQGEKGDRGSDGLSSLLVTVKEPKGKNCSNGGQHLMSGLDGNRDWKLQIEEVDNDSFVCNGADGQSGSAGRPGKNGNTRVQFGLGMRASAIWSADRPVGISAAPEAQLELWLAPTAEFVAGIAWAPEGDRNMIITSQLRWRALNKRVGLGLGVQYQAWNLEGNKALWQTVAGLASVQLVVIDSKYIDVSLDAGLLVGADGYDSDAQAAVGGTGGLTFSLKL